MERFADHIGLTRTEAEPAAAASRSVLMPARRPPLGRDVEAPEAFQITAPAVWDGRPSFGQIWIAVPDAIQPERVVIRNETTGATVRGGMFAARPDNPDAPIKLSSAAAAALGIEMGSPITLTVTAIRKQAPDAQPAQPDMMIASRPADPVPDIAVTSIVPVEVTEAPRPIATTPPALYPAPSTDDGYVEVAQAYTADGAVRVQAQLAAASIPAEIQEDFVDGQAYYRVFARREDETERLYIALSEIEFTSEAEGSDDGTVIAEIPDMSTHAEPEGTGVVWVEFGAYPSMNEAKAVAQRLSRRDIPSEICSGRQGLLKIHRVFAGPAGEGDASVESASFCAGVAAAEAARPAPEVRAAMAPALLAAPASATEPSGPVRIKVGEATGSLRLTVPEKFSPPHEISVEGVTVSVPAVAPPELLDRIRAALGNL